MTEPFPAVADWMAAMFARRTSARQLPDSLRVKSPHWRRWPYFSEWSGSGRQSYPSGHWRDLAPVPLSRDLFLVLLRW